MLAPSPSRFPLHCTFLHPGARSPCLPLLAPLPPRAQPWRIPRSHHAMPSWRSLRIAPRVSSPFEAPNEALRKGTLPYHAAQAGSAHRLRQAHEFAQGWRDPATSLLRVWCEVRESCRTKLTSRVLRMAMGRFRFVVSDHYFQEERSALYTFPNLRNFRVAVLRDFRRVFAHVAPVFLDRGIANIETKELSSLSVEPCMGESIIVTVFEIPVAEVSAFIEREHEFRFLAVTVEDEDGQPFSQRAVVCARYNDEEYRRIRCRGSSEEYQKRYGKHNVQQIWRDDIFPCRVYLRHCVLAAKNLGSDAYNNFLDHTYLGDRTITIRKYFEAGLGVVIMDEQPPVSLRDRYGG